MVPLSDFLKLNKPNVIKFIDEISDLKVLNEAQVIRINDFYEETGDSNIDTDVPVNFKEIHVQFENASCKYLAVLNRLLNTHVPQMKAYLDDNEKKANVDNDLNKEFNKSDLPDEDSNFHSSLEKLINILNGINDKVK